MTYAIGIDYADAKLFPITLSAPDCGIIFAVDHKKGATTEPNARLTTHLTRDVIRRGADQLGWALDDVITRTIAAVQTFEA